MGLDMYLYGRLHHWHGWEKDSPRDRTEGGKRVRSIEVDLGYWRKHPNLHGYLVQTFMDGKDECQEIELSADDLRQTLAAVETGRLPLTSGFFFGKSDGSERAEDIRLLSEALEWLEASDIAPAEPASATPVGGGFVMMQIKLDETQAKLEAMSGKPPAQRVSRSVHYSASW